MTQQSPVICLDCLLSNDEKQSHLLSVFAINLVVKEIQFPVTAEVQTWRLIYPGLVPV